MTSEERRRLCDLCLSLKWDVDLGVNTDNRLNQKTNTEAVEKKVMSRRYFFCVQQN